MRRLSILPLLTLAGCLSTPSAAEVDAEVPPIDAVPPRCQPGARPAAQTWPPPGLVVHTMQIADVDADERSDLVVAADSGIYVLYGPLPAAAPFAYHAHVETDVFAPHGLRIEDLDGDACPDLVAAGPAASAGQPGYLAIWRHDQSGRAWGGEPVRERLHRELSQGVHLAWADLSSEAALDLVVGDTNGNAEMFVGATASELPPPLAIDPPSCGWDYMNALHTRPDAAGGDRVLAFGLLRWNAITLDGQGVPIASEHCTRADSPLMARWGLAVDLDGVPPDDVLTGGVPAVGAYTIAGTGDPALVTAGIPSCPVHHTGNFYSEGLAVGDLGGFADPEVVVIDHDAGSPGISYACLIDGVKLDGTTLSASAVPTEIELGPGPASAVAIGDLLDDAASEVWTMHVDGTLRCFRRGSSPVLEGC